MGDAKLSPARGCGGIGRRARFRSVWGQPRGGSSPLIRIIPRECPALSQVEVSHPQTPALDFQDIADRLYGLPVEEFTHARNEAAAELRKAGRRDEAERIKALRKPTAAAAAVNRLVHEHRADVEKFLAAASAL